MATCDYNIYTLDIKVVVAKKSFIALDLHFAHFEGGAKLPFQNGCQFNFSEDWYIRKYVEDAI